MGGVGVEEGRAGGEAQRWGEVGACTLREGPGVPAAAGCPMGQAL